MKLTCPACGASASAEAWENDVNARRCLAAVACLPPVVGRHALTYVGLFRDPGSARGMAWKKATRIVGELAELVAVDWVQWDQRPARSASPSLWAEVLEEMIARPPRSLPLSNHNYLRKVVYDRADKVDAVSEAEQNQAERRGVAITAEDRANRGNEAEALGTVIERMDPKEMRRIRIEKMGGRHGKD